MDTPGQGATGAVSSAIFRARAWAIAETDSEMADGAGRWRRPWALHGEGPDGRWAGSVCRFTMASRYH